MQSWVSSKPYIHGLKAPVLLRVDPLNVHSRSLPVPINKRCTTYDALLPIIYNIMTDLKYILFHFNAPFSIAVQLHITPCLRLSIGQRLHPLLISHHAHQPHSMVPNYVAYSYIIQYLWWITYIGFLPSQDKTPFL